MTKREMNCTIRGLKLWTTAGLMLILVLSSGPALASSSFMVTNQSDTIVKVRVYDGKDSVCDYARHEHHIDAQESWDSSCEGDGKHRCKVEFWTGSSSSARTDNYICGTLTPYGSNPDSTGSNNCQLAVKIGNYDKISITNDLVCYFVN